MGKDGKAKDAKGKGKQAASSSDDAGGGKGGKGKGKGGKGGDDLGTCTYVKGTITDPYSQFAVTSRD
jgi:NIMA-interacting peptidyl-prolyl cis-trans isomerase 4